MQYSLYDYYKNSFLTLEEVLKHYVDHFYLNKYGRNKVDKVQRKATECDRMKELFGLSIQNRDFPERTPDFNDFSLAVSKTLWFLTQSNDTIALATLAAAVEWNNTINSRFLIVDEQEFRNNILNVFRKLDICEEISEHDYRVMTDPYVYSRMASTEAISPSVQKVNAKMKLRTIIGNAIQKLKDAEESINYLGGTALTSQQRRNLYINLVSNQIDNVGNDTRRIANTYSIDLDTLIEEELDKTGLFE